MAQNVSITFTADEANRLLGMLVQTPLPYQLSAPIIERIGRALAEAQNGQMVGQAAGHRNIFAVNDDAADEPEHQPLPNN